MSTRVATTAEAAPRPRVNRTLGDGAGVLALALVLFSLAGVAWGAWRPTYSATVSGDGNLLLSGAGEAQFTSYITFALVTGLLAVGFSLFSYVRLRDVRGMPMLLWVTVLSFLAAMSFWAVGGVVADLLHQIPEPQELETGQELHIVPTFSPGVASVAAPVMASLSYWLSSVLDVFAPVQDEE